MHIFKLFIVCIFSITTSYVFADRIYIMNAGGYNEAGTELIAAITNNGHTVTNNTTALTSLPAGFTSSCVDAINGYDWLCFFGNSDFTSLTADIQAFIDVGGKVFYQYEVVCCTASASSVANIASTLTGTVITPNSEPYISFGGGTAMPAWESVGCCVTLYGNAYRCLEGIPSQNQLMATGDVGVSNPTFSTCPVFGFALGSTNFVSGANQGGMIGFGDINIWYDGTEPWANGGSDPVNPAIVDYIFPNSSSNCYIFEAGCSVQVISPNLGGSASLGPDIELCAGTTLTLDGGSLNTSFLWQDNSTNQTFNVTGPGTYWVEVDGTCGATSDTIVITEIEIPSVDLGPDLSICESNTLSITANIQNATSFEWQDGSSNITLDVSSPGTYWVTATSTCGDFTDSIDVNPVSPPNIDLGTEILGCIGQEIVLDATTPNGVYTWSNGVISAQNAVSDPGEYWVIVDVNNCVGMDTVNIIFETCQVILDMPNIFTPNSDLTNELFLPVNMDGIEEAHIIILNRWGNLVYESNDILFGWDGTNQNKACVEGVYFWKISYTDILGASHAQHGFVTLSR